MGGGSMQGSVVADSQGKTSRYDEQQLIKVIDEAFEGLDLKSKDEFVQKILRTVAAGKTTTAQEIERMLELEAAAFITAEEPDYTFVAARFLLNRLYQEIAEKRGCAVHHVYSDFYGLVKALTDKALYSREIMDRYSKAEIEAAGKFIDPEKDKLFHYVGLRTMIDRYLTKDHDHNVLELPQERFLVIAMVLMQNESKEKRLALVKEAYWALSNLYMTVATPTLANAGKTHGQLSSCFIDTVEDSLRGIYDNNTDVATLSKNGGGIGVYMGKVRARGSDIKKFKGVSSGVIPWIKGLNNTAVSVDQLGQRQGAIAVYLDVWHKDIIPFLELRLNNGDERYRAHDVFTGVCIPDLFMEKVRDREDWHLFDPHEVRRVMGFALEDFYDEEKGDGEFRRRYQMCVDHPELSRTTVPAIEIFKKIMASQLETGTPYMFYRDTANRMNPNKHKGIIYSSNLCTEIAQNMSPTTVVQEELVLEDGESRIIIVKKPGDFVVCNLSSINLGRAVGKAEGEYGVLDRLIPIQVRMLDNVIDLNDIEVLQAKYTNQRYRAVGLGTFGWHHLLALKNIRWESEEAVAYADRLYEYIAYKTIEASKDLAKEKGKYPLFAGSEWATGEYFIRRGYIDRNGKNLGALDWASLAEEVREHGLRNGYLMAVAPNSTTALIGGSTASVDPVYRKIYSEEKKNYKITVTAPDLNPTTWWLYKHSVDIDQEWSIRQNAARQRHIDQSISFNIYVYHNVKAKKLLELHLKAWENGLKSTYYVRSTTFDQEDCESCQS